MYKKASATPPQKMASDKTGTRIMAIILATLVQVEGWPVDHKIEARDFANAREVGLRVLGQDFCSWRVLRPRPPLPLCRPLRA